MIDNLYEIKYELTQKDLIAYHACFFEKGNKTIYAILLMLVYINLVMGGLNAISQAIIFNLYWVNKITPVVLAVFWVLGHLPSITYFFKSLAKEKTQGSPTSVAFTNDQITGSSNGKTNNFSYGTIKKAMFTRKHSFLVFNNDEVLIIPNKALGKENVNSFKEFLRTKVTYAQKSAEELKRIKQTRVGACVALLILPVLYYAVFVLIPATIGR